LELDLDPGKSEALGTQRSTSPTNSEGESTTQRAESIGEAASIAALSSSVEDGLRDLCMLQHILLRVMTIEVLPSFLLSEVAKAEVDKELAMQSSRKALHDVLQLELSSVAAALPATAEEWAATFSAAVQFLPHAVLLCDMSLPGAPIMSANSAFEILTQYENNETIGRSCRFLQGSKTDPKALEALSEAIRTHSACHVTLQNYRQDGTPFLNLLSLKPIFDSNGFCCYMIGCPVEVSDHYSGTKTQLRHVDRLLKLTASHLVVPSAPDAHRRMEQVRATVMREKPSRLCNFDDARSEMSTNTSLSHARHSLDRRDSVARNNEKPTNASGTTRETGVVQAKGGSVAANGMRASTSSRPGEPSPPKATRPSSSRLGSARAALSASPAVASPPPTKSPTMVSPRAQKMIKATGAVTAAPTWKPRRKNADATVAGTGVDAASKLSGHKNDDSTRPQSARASLAAAPVPLSQVHSAQIETAAMQQLPIQQSWVEQTHANAAPAEVQVTAPDESAQQGMIVPGVDEQKTPPAPATTIAPPAPSPVPVPASPLLPAFLFQ